MIDKRDITSNTLIKRDYDLLNILLFKLFIDNS